MRGNSQRKSIEEAETHITSSEEKLDRTESALTSATKWIACLEVKIDDLESRGWRKNIQVLGLEDVAEGRLLDLHDMVPQWLGLGPDLS